MLCVARSVPAAPACRSFAHSSVKTARVTPVVSSRTGLRYSSRPTQTRQASTRRYTKDHEWISVNGNEGTIGISTFAQNALGDVVYVELPEVGSAFKKKDVIASVESVKAASDVYSPVSGTVTAVNSNLSSEPSILNKSPEEDGWMVKLQLNNAATELTGLMDVESYKKFCEAEEH